MRRRHHVVGLSKSPEYLIEVHFLWGWCGMKPKPTYLRQGVHDPVVQVDRVLIAVVAEEDLNKSLGRIAEGLHHLQHPSLVLEGTIFALQHPKEHLRDEHLDLGLEVSLCRLRCSSSGKQYAPGDLLKTLLRSRGTICLPWTIQQHYMPACPAVIFTASNLVFPPAHKPERRLRCHTHRVP